MTRLPLAVPLAAAAFLGGCFDVSNPGTPFLVVSPILDSLFVGDTLNTLTLSYFDANGQPQPAGTAAWSSALQNVACSSAP